MLRLECQLAKISGAKFTAIADRVFSRLGAPAAPVRFFHDAISRGVYSGVSGGLPVLEDGSIRKLDVKEGDRILFGKYSGSEVKIEGEDHLILREDEVLGILES